MRRSRGLANLVDEATAAFDRFDYARALERTEGFFWPFCDDYLELVKNRAYGSGTVEGRDSALMALRTALATLLRLFAPFFPFVTEEVWSWWQPGSIHRSSWPSGDDLRGAAGAGDPDVLAVAADVLGEVRKAKTEAKRSMRAEVEQVVVRDTPQRLAALRLVEGDVRSAGVIETLELAEAPELDVDVTLADA